MQKGGKQGRPHEGASAAETGEALCTATDKKEISPKFC